MFGGFNPDELAVVIADKIKGYQREAELEGQLPKHALRRRMARLLRAWAEALEPAQGPKGRLREA